MGANGTIPGPSDPPATHEIVHATSLSTGVLVLLLITWTLAGHKVASRTPYLTEGSAACALGFLTGLVLLVFHTYMHSSFIEQLLEFNAASFFTFLLPPVIFYCGLSVEKARFFTNLPSILMLGVLGTLLSFLLISLLLYVMLGLTSIKLLDCLALGAIFAATDSVATLQVLNRGTLPTLFSLVFGEGVINDATAIVLLGSVSRQASGGPGIATGIMSSFLYLFTTSLAMGSASGLAIAFVLKRASLSGPHQECAVVALLGYFSYLGADVLGLSGILSLFCCGIVVSHYALNNLSPEGSAATLTTFRTMSYLAEGMIFLYVGMDAMDPLKWKSANAAEALWLVLVLVPVLAGTRAVFVVPFAMLHNMWAVEKLSSRDVVIVWWAGLMRGAVSVALVYVYFDDNPNSMMADRQRATLIVATLVVVLLSILGCGGLTKPLLAMMLQDESVTLFDQLRTIPLLSKLDSHGHLAGLVAGERRAQQGGQQGPPSQTALLQPQGAAPPAWRPSAGLPPLARAGLGVRLQPPPGVALELREAAGRGPPGGQGGSGGSSGGGGSLGIQELWGGFDARVMQPLFGGPPGRNGSAQADGASSAGGAGSGTPASHPGLGGV